MAGGDIVLMPVAVRALFSRRNSRTTRESKATILVFFRVDTAHRCFSPEPLGSAARLARFRAGSIGFSAAAEAGSHGSHIRR